MLWRRTSAMYAYQLGSCICSASWAQQLYTYVLQSRCNPRQYHVMPVQKRIYYLTKSGQLFFVVTWHCLVDIFGPCVYGQIVAHNTGAHARLPMCSHVYHCAHVPSCNSSLAWASGPGPACNVSRCNLVDERTRARARVHGCVRGSGRRHVLTH